MKQLGWNIKFCSTPQVSHEAIPYPWSHSDKVAWIEKYFDSEMATHLILTHDKTLIRGDILIDDRVNIHGLHEGQEDWTHILFKTHFNQHRGTRASAGTRFGSKVIHNWQDNWESVIRDAL